MFEVDGEMGIKSGVARMVTVNCQSVQLLCMLAWKVQQETCNSLHYYFMHTSGPTPQVASSAAHMSAQANKKDRKEKEKKENYNPPPPIIKITLSGTRTRVVMFTDSVSNHSSMGARSHRTD